VEQLVRNPLRAEIDGASLSWTRDPMTFHARLPGYAPTDAIDLDIDGLPHLVVKAETSRFGLPSFKMLGASWATYRALVDRMGSEPAWTTVDELADVVASALGPLSLAAATDGNHGRAVARMARLLGLGARIFVPAGMADARIGAIESEGATVTVVDGTYDDAVARSAEVAGDDCLVISDTSWPGYVDTPRHVIEGYSTVFFELDDAGVDVPDAVFVPAGVGAFAAACVSHYVDRSTIVSVEPADADCVLESAVAGHLTEVPGPHRSMMVGLNCGLPSLVAWPVVSRGLDWCAAVADERAADALRLLAANGIEAGETGSASLAGVLLAVERGLVDPASTALVLVTEGVTDPVNWERLAGRAPSASAA
jgi:diaminopropionate ammonia-lyase